MLRYIRKSISRLMRLVDACDTIPTVDNIDALLAAGSAAEPIEVAALRAGDHGAGDLTLNWDWDAEPYYTTGDDELLAILTAER